MDSEKFKSRVILTITVLSISTVHGYNKDSFVVHFELLKITHRITENILCVAQLQSHFQFYKMRETTMLPNKTFAEQKNKSFKALIFDPLKIIEYNEKFCY